MDTAIMTRAAELAIAALGFPGLTLPHMDLFSNDLTPNKNSVWADFTIPTYTGYAQVSTALSAVYVSQPSNIVTVDVAEASFIGPTAGAGTDVYGWVLSDGTTHAVWAAGRFGDAPLSENNILDKVSVDASLMIVGTAESVTES